MRMTNPDVPQKANFKTVVSNGIWVYKTLLKMSPSTIVELTISKFAMGILPTLTVLYMSKIIDQLVNLSGFKISSFLDLIQKKEILIPIVIYALTQAVIHINNNFFWYLESKVSKYYLILFEVELEKRISNLDIQHFENPKVMDGLRKATDNSYKMYGFFHDSIDLIRYVISVIVSAYIIIKLSSTFGLIIFICTIPRIWIAIDYINRTWYFFNSTFETRRRSWWLSNSLKYSENRGEAIITKSNIFVYNLVSKIWNFLGSSELKILKRTFILDAFVTIITFVRTIFTPIFLFYKTIIRNISIGEFTFYFQKIEDFNNDVFNLTTKITNLWDSGSYITFIRNIFEIQPVIKSGNIKIKTDVPLKIEFHNVWFKYPRSKRFILKNINMTINSGNEIALVGENGAGKTTLIKLLLRFYDPTKGKIFINGIPLKDVDLTTYYKSIGALFQDFQMFTELSIEQNIRLGDFKTKKNFNAVESASQKADCDSFIDKLEYKYNQILNKSFTHGTNLSTGQWQKIALARMFYRNAPVLILDEPTASIDANAEFRIFKRIFETFKGKTLIIISHRFSTVRNAQKIYVIHDGEIVEEGSHEELIKKNRRYKKAFDLQAKGYKS